MIIRILTAQIAPGRLDDWWKYSKDIGFPVMRRQPGMKGIYRLRRPNDDMNFAYLTFWDSVEDLDRFRTSDDMAFVLREGQGLTVKPSTELLFDYLPDGEDVEICLGQAKSGAGHAP